MKNFSIFCLFCLMILVDFTTASAADFKVVGRLVFEDIQAVSLVVDDMSVYGYVVGQEVKNFGELSYEDDMQFEMDVKDLASNNQLVVVGEGVKDGIGYFGSVTTVITEKELQSGLISNLLIDMHELPTPVYETSNDKLIKVCWGGLDEFSVVGYEVYRSELVEGDWEPIGRSGQNASKQVCFVDSSAEKDVKYYYRIGALTSWNAGEGREVMVSLVNSGVSNGMMINFGVVDKINQEIDDKSIERDLTASTMIDVTPERVYFSQFDQALDRVGEFIESRGWSYELFLIGILAGILLLVIIFFVISVSLANVRSSGSDLWGKK